MENKLLVRSFKGIQARKLIEILQRVQPETKVCIDVLGDNFPIKIVDL